MERGTRTPGSHCEPRLMKHRNNKPSNQGAAMHQTLHAYQASPLQGSFEAGMSVSLVQQKGKQRLKPG